MLEYLRIKNLALIHDMELEFAFGLNVLTGESGAGKSFILRALDFITGDRLDTSLVRPGEDRAVVEALFVLPDGEVALRRELSAESNRSRVFVNDALSGQERIRAIAPGLLLHTSQHSQQRLLKPSFHVQVVDDCLSDREWLVKKDSLLEGLRNIAQERTAIETRCQELAQRRDLLEYQREEIAKVNPLENEEEELQGRKGLVQKSSQCREAVDTSLGLLEDREAGLLALLARLERSTQLLGEVHPDQAEMKTLVTEARLALETVNSRLRRFSREESASHGADDTEAIESRLFALAQLKRKLKRSLPEIVSLRDEIAANLSFLDAVNLDLIQLSKREQEVREQTQEVLAKVSELRRQAAAHLKGELEAQLHRLGFSSHAAVEFEFASFEAAPGLFEDRPRLNWLPNPGQPAQPLDRIASGGELSRFLLALVSLRSKSDLPTLLFDEVDSGIGGLTLNQVGEQLKALSKRQQVILITHWPQLASLADRHFQVAKEVRGQETFTLCRPLSSKEALNEISRMAGGGQQGLALARSLSGR